MKKLITFLLLIFTISNFAQIKGIITDHNGIPLPFVTILLDNTYKTTTSDEHGNYILHFKTLGKYTLIFRCLGYKTQKVTVTVEKLPYILDVELSDENIALKEVFINPKENTANKIIKKAIKHRKINTEKTAHYKADFYSKVSIKLNLPKDVHKVKILGHNGSYHDTIPNGIAYLSETISKLAYQKPDKLKETIIASRISGFNDDFSCNTATEANFDFYENTINLKLAGSMMISPIAKNAFNYYKFKMEGTFIDENGQTINKIKVTAKRDSDPVFDGFIYIVEDSWAIYAVDLNTMGYRTNFEALNILNLKQNFSYNKDNDLWAKSSQSLDYDTGRKHTLYAKYNYIYSDYEFTDAFDKKTFTNEIVNFEENSNKKDQSFWKAFRPVPLSEEENKNYIKMDSLAPIRNTKPVLDSIDKKYNKFNFFKAFFWKYEYKNSYKKESYKFAGLGSNTSFPIFNTVQGWNISTGFSLTHKNENNKGKYSSVNTTFNYGFSENRFRITANYFHQFNNRNYAHIGISGGSIAAQFNPEEPITGFINTISSLFFEDNYMKLYNKEFANINYGQYAANGLLLKGKLEYSQRKPLYNNTNLVWVKHDDNYTSNNPQLPNDYLTPAFNPHHLTKASLSAKINFGTKYISRPDGRTILTNKKYPTIYLDYYNAFAASDKNYNHQFYSAKVDYEITADDKGTFATSISSGKFINSKNITFVDYKHFNGNQTHFGTTGHYLNAFNLMPYYTNSTNDAFFENHTEYWDNGFIMNKIPLKILSKSNLVLGFHNLTIPKMKPYMEFTIGLNQIGIGKAKKWRVDYVRSYQNGFKGDGVVFGLKFFDIINN
ncbi:MAG: DUF5686 and carboxypeptidase regulatory-like domain-containing protein [Flavobacterium sp.]